MSVQVQTDKYGRRNVVCDRSWPDGKRFRRIMPNRTVAKKIDLRIASAIAVGTWRELREELLYGTRSDYSVTEYADHYLEVYCKVHNKDWKRKQSSLKHVKRLLGKVLLQEVEPRQVHEFVSRRIREFVPNRPKETVKPATVNRDVTILKHMFEFAVDEGVLKQNPIARIKKLKEYREDRPRINEKDLQLILKQLPFPVKQMVLSSTKPAVVPVRR